MTQSPIDVLRVLVKSKPVAGSDKYDVCDWECDVFGYIKDHADALIAEVEAMREALKAADDLTSYVSAFNICNKNKTTKKDVEMWLVKYQRARQALGETP